VEELTIAGELPALSSSVKTEQRLALAVRNIGRVIRLDDPMFSRDSYSMGMWRPLDFLDRVGGGLLFLQNYEKDRIPVIFVHGINGGPTDLTSLVDSLDRNRFQPWVLYYPSGARLDIISDYLATAVAEMQSRHGFTRFAVVSHSMGGLVTRSFVKKYVEQYPDRFKNLALVMTINSPMEGMPSAAMGVKAPFMIQSWRDLTPGSDFLEEIHAWSWPPTIPYYLMFSYESGKDGDGVVALKSQIPFKLQREAVRMYGFNNSHAGTLRDEDFLRQFSTIVGSVIE
jgi:pimeloyl-ACP methyl ester carboxylesterase